MSCHSEDLHFTLSGFNRIHTKLVYVGLGKFADVCCKAPAKSRAQQSHHF